MPSGLEKGAEFFNLPVYWILMLMPMSVLCRNDLNVQILDYPPQMGSEHKADTCNLVDCSVRHNFYCSMPYGFIQCFDRGYFYIA